jgi:hypothetical protein
VFGFVAFGTVATRGGAGGATRSSGGSGAGSPPAFEQPRGPMTTSSPAPTIANSRATLPQRMREIVSLTSL